MNADNSAYLDTSALAKWYLNEQNSDEFSVYIQKLDVAIISSLTCVEMRSLLARRRRMSEIDVELESTIYTSFQDDISHGHLQLYHVENSNLEAAVNLIDRYPKYPLRTLDALHLAIVRSYGIASIATADEVMSEVAIEMGCAVRLF